MNKKTIKTQIGISAGADFSESTWTFKMPEDYIVVAGEFAIVDKALYDELVQYAIDLEIPEMNLVLLYLLPVARMIKKLKELNQ